MTLQPTSSPQPRALYKGMLSPLLGMAAINSVVFGVHAKVMQILQPEAILMITSPRAVCRRGHSWDRSLGGTLTSGRCKVENTS